MRLKTFVVQPAHFSLNLQARWGAADACRNCCGMQGTAEEHASEHYAHIELKVEPGGDSIITSIQASRVNWPVRCGQCGEPAPADVEVQVYTQPVFNCDDAGRLAPGSIYFQPHAPGKCREWDNCDGRHLTVVLPNHCHWDVDGRASNCDRKGDRTHRCWVRHGDPTKGEFVHVDKAGETCGAGAGSIVMADFHGFLHNGEITSC